MMMKHFTMDTMTGAAKWAAALLLAVCLGGCQTARVAQPLTSELAGNEPQTQMEFWHTLGERPVTSNDEAFHGLILYMDERDDAGDYAQRVGLLQSRGMLDGDFDHPASEAVTRGTMAVAIVRLLDIEGGVTMRVFGPTPRYATRELRYMNFYMPSSPQQTFTGSEFLGLMGRVEDSQRVAHPADADSLRPEEEAAPAPEDEGNGGEGGA